MTQQIKIADHINTDHKAYAAYDNERSIPHIADGLKPSQRKLYFASRTIPMSKEIKVANLASKASDLAHYKHGEDSLQDTLVKMTQDFTGSNNLPWFLKEGAFGTKMDWDASEPRYIFVKRSPTVEGLFDKSDEDLLTKQHEDGEEIEPEFYLPAFPMILLNGAAGIGNGYSTSILPRLFSSLKPAIEAVLSGSPCPPLPIGFKGFKGRVEPVGKSFRVTGKVEKVNRTTVKIVDLPPDQSFQWDEYKKRVMLPLLESKEINSYANDSTETEWNIVIKAPMAFFDCTSKELEAKLGLSLNMTETVVAWDWAGRLTKFENAEALLVDWVKGRLPFYEARRLSTIADLEKEVHWLTSKIWFLKYWNANSTRLIKLKTEEIREELIKQSSYDESIVDRWMTLRISNLTLEEVEALEAECAKVMDNHKYFSSCTGIDLMRVDLASLKLG